MQMSNCGLCHCFLMLWLFAALPGGCDVVSLEGNVQSCRVLVDGSSACSTLPVRWISIASGLLQRNHNCSENGCQGSCMSWFLESQCFSPINFPTCHVQPVCWALWDRQSSMRSVIIFLNVHIELSHLGVYTHIRLVLVLCAWPWMSHEVDSALQACSIVLLLIISYEIRFLAFRWSCFLGSIGHASFGKNWALIVQSSVGLQPTSTSVSLFTWGELVSSSPDNDDACNICWVYWTPESGVVSLMCCASDCWGFSGYLWAFHVFDCKNISVVHSRGLTSAIYCKGKGRWIIIRKWKVIISNFISCRYICMIRAYILKSPPFWRMLLKIHQFTPPPLIIIIQ